MPDETNPAPPPVARHLRTDLHVHSTYSDGHSTVEALVERAASRGLALAITDHYSIDQKMNTIERLAAYVDALEPLPVYRGVEVDIGEELPIPPEIRARLDLVIGSVHNVTTDPGVRYPVAGRQWDEARLDEYMEHYVAALVRGLAAGGTPLGLTFIGHPTFLVGLPAQSPAQHDALWTAPRRRAVIEAAVAGGVAFEISTRYRVPSPTFMREAIDAGMLFAVGSDSHWIDRVAEFSLPLRYIAEFSLPPERFILPRRVLDGGPVASR